MRRRERWERPSYIPATILGSYLLSPTTRELDRCRGKSTLFYYIACPCVEARARFATSVSSSETVS